MKVSNLIGVSLTPMKGKLTGPTANLGESLSNRNVYDFSSMPELRKLGGETQPHLPVLQQPIGIHLLGENVTSKNEGRIVMIEENQFKTSEISTNTDVPSGPDSLK